MGENNDYTHLREFMERVEKTMSEGFERIHTEMKDFGSKQIDHEKRILKIEFEKEINKDSFHKIVTIISLIIGFIGLVTAFLTLT